MIVEQVKTFVQVFFIAMAIITLMVVGAMTYYGYMGGKSFFGDVSDSSDEMVGSIAPSQTEDGSRESMALGPVTVGEGKVVPEEKNRFRFI